MCVAQYVQAWFIINLLVSSYKRPVAMAVLETYHVFFASSLSPVMCPLCVWLKTGVQHHGQDQPTNSWI